MGKPRRRRLVASKAAPAQERPTPSKESPMVALISVIIIFLLSGLLFHLEGYEHARNASVIAAQFMLFVIAVKDVIS
jgi:hypothetical protein